MPSLALFLPPFAPPGVWPPPFRLSPHELQQVLEQRSAAEVLLHRDVPKGTTGSGEGASGQRGTREQASRTTLDLDILLPSCGLSGGQDEPLQAFSWARGALLYFSAPRV